MINLFGILTGEAPGVGVSLVRAHYTYLQGVLTCLNFDDMVCTDESLENILCELVSGRPGPGVAVAEIVGKRLKKRRKDM